MEAGRGKRALLLPCSAMDKAELIEVRASLLDALALLETLLRGPDGNEGNGGLESRRAMETTRRVCERIKDAAGRLLAAITAED